MAETITINLDTAARGPAGADGAATFTALTDAPSSYTGQGLKFVRVNSGGTALEFVTASGTGDALVASTLDQFADVTQTSGATLAITASTTLSGGTHSGTNTGDQDLSSYVTLTGAQTLSNKTLTAPILGTPASGNFSSGTFTWPTFNQNTTGSAATVTTINGRIAEGTNVTLTGTGTAADPYVINAAGGGGGGTWGSITGTLSAQTDLQAVLDEKITSDPTGVTGADAVTNIISLTQAEYDAIGSPSASTYYIITDATAPVLVTDYNANTILYATTDNTPVALTVGASTFVGRKSTGDIVALTPAEARTELGVKQVLGFACSDETTLLTTGQKIACDMPYGMVVTRVYASLTTAPTGSACTVDIEDEGTSILNAVLSIGTSNNNAETSTFASAASSYTFSKGDLLTIDIDSVGSANAGLKVFLEGYMV